MGLLERVRSLLETRRHKQCDPVKVLDKHGYRLISCVNRGRFETVYLAASKETNQRVAIKISEEGNCMIGERLHWMWVNHENCVNLFERFTVHGYSYYVSEYAQNGDVMTFLKSTGQPFGPHLEEFARRITRQVLQALDHCHSKELAHLDIKWTNILLDETLNTKLAGFGFLCSKTAAEGICLGDSFYQPPEALTIGVSRHTLDKVDIWELGAALVHMLIGWYMPVLNALEKDNIPDLAVSLDIPNQKVRLPNKLSKSGLSTQVQNFLELLLQYRPESRPTAREALQHPWIAQCPGNLTVSRRATD